MDIERTITINETTWDVQAATEQDYAEALLVIQNGLAAFYNVTDRYRAGVVKEPVVLSESLVRARIRGLRDGLYGLIQMLCHDPQTYKARVHINDLITVTHRLDDLVGKEGPSPTSPETYHLITYQLGRLEDGCVLTEKTPAEWLYETTVGLQERGVPERPKILFCTPITQVEHTKLKTLVPQRTEG